MLIHIFALFELKNRPPSAVIAGFAAFTYLADRGQYIINPFSEGFVTLNWYFSNSLYNVIIFIE